MTEKPMEDSGAGTESICSEAINESLDDIWELCDCDCHDTYKFRRTCCNRVLRKDVKADINPVEFTKFDPQLSEVFRVSSAYNLILTLKEQWDALDNLQIWLLAERKRINKQLLAGLENG